MIKYQSNVHKITVLHPSILAPQEDFLGVLQLFLFTIIWITYLKKCNQLLKNYMQGFTYSLIAFPWSLF